MKKTAALLITLILLAGCSDTRDRIDRAMALRSKLLAADGCSFLAEVTADYGDELYSFTLECTGDSLGNVHFTVAEPESIAGITGEISQDGGKLTFEDTALEFPLLADDQVTPVSAPWLVLKTLRAGYLTSAGDEDGLLRVTINDSYEEDALRLDIWLDPENIPVRADIFYDGRRILSVEIGDFQIL